MFHLDPIVFISWRPMARVIISKKPGNDEKHPLNALECK
jgi:hypothetical protein